MTREQLALAQRAASTDADRRRLMDGYQALQIFTLSHVRSLWPRERQPARKSLRNAIDSLRSLGDLGTPEAREIAQKVLAELERRCAALDADQAK